MSAADLVAQLAEAGTPPALLAAVAKELFGAEAERSALAERRKNERERKARSRDGTGQDVTAREVTGQLVTPPTPSPEVSPQTPHPNPIHTPGVSPRARKDPVFVCPEGVDPQHWGDFLANRKTKRLTNSPTAYRGVLRDLAKFADDEWPPGRVVEFAAEAGWGAIFDPRTNYRTQQNGRSGTNGMGGHQSGGDGLSATRRAAIRAFGPPAAGNQPPAPG